MGSYGLLGSISPLLQNVYLPNREVQRQGIDNNTTISTNSNVNVFISCKQKENKLKQLCNKIIIDEHKLGKATVLY